MLQFKGPYFPLKFGKRILGLQMGGGAFALFCPPPPPPRSLWTKFSNNP